MSNPKQLNFLADHIKLSLLERQRAVALNIEQTTQDGHISRSLEDLKSGLENLAKERIRLENAGDTTAYGTLQETFSKIQSQYNDLHSQFHGHPPPDDHNLISPNDPSLSTNFARASSLTSSSMKKSVRFTDDAEAQRTALFPSTYRDDPMPPSSDPSIANLDNQQLHAYHSWIIQEQDDQLDRLGESIGRQRELSIQIGDELDGHMQLLDEIDGRVDRHQSRLNQARNGLGKVARKAGDNKQLTTIIVLIVILVFLILVLKG